MVKSKETRRAVYLKAVKHFCSTENAYGICHSLNASYKDQCGFFGDVYIEFEEIALFKPLEREGHGLYWWPSLDREPRALALLFAYYMTFDRPKKKIKGGNKK